MKKTLTLKDKLSIIVYKVAFFLGLSAMTFAGSFAIAMWNYMEYPQADYRVDTLFLFTVLECVHVFWLTALNFFSYSKQLS